MSKNKSKILLLILSLAILHSCGPVREVVTPADPEAVSVSRTLSALREKESDFDFFSARISGIANIDNSSYNFSGNIRIRKDSAIFVSISPFLGIEMARVLITPDRVQMLNRLEGTYFEGEMDLINSMLNTQLDYYMLQSLLVGNDFRHFSSENFRASHDRDRLLLQNPERRPETGGNPGVYFQQNIWLDSESFRITENLLYDPVSRSSIRARYESFDQITGQYMPRDISLVFIDPANRADLSLRYTRTSLNEPVPITFSVPERYRQMTD